MFMITRCNNVIMKEKGVMKERVSKLTYPRLQHCLRMLHIIKESVGQSGRNYNCISVINGYTLSINYNTCKRIFFLY